MVSLEIGGGQRGCEIDGEFGCSRRRPVLRHGGQPDVTFPRDRRAPKEEGGPG